jgi:hypothetical protein
VGAEVDVNPEPPRAKFKEAKLKGEPPTDLKIILESGIKLRERIVWVPVEASAVGDVQVTDGALNLVVTHALLTDDDKVATAPGGAFRIKSGSQRHEIAFDAERMGGMSDEQVQAAELQQREVAAHKAERFFGGIERFERLLGGRVTVPLATAGKE